MSTLESAPRGGVGSIALGELSGIVLRRSSLLMVRDLGARNNTLAPPLLEH
jgi:hypothetical protein